MRKTLIVSFVCLAPGFHAFGESLEFDRSIPNEYETVGGHSLGMANSGVASVGGVAAVRMNPGLLAAAPEYSISGGYNWPTDGRDFFQAGVVDTKSSKIAAGFLYSGFGNAFETARDIENVHTKDAPINRRAVLALGQSFKAISLGINGEYVDAYKSVNKKSGAAYERVTGTSLGFGFAGNFTESLRFGGSVENMANRKVAEYSPRTFRAGVAYFFGEAVSAHFDLRQRDRIPSLEISEGDEPVEVSEDKKYRQPERMAIASFSAKIYDIIRVMAGYGQSVAGADRKTLSGGVAVVSQNMAISYTAARPYMTSEVAQQAVNVSMSISL